MRESKLKVVHGIGRNYTTICCDNWSIGGQLVCLTVRFFPVYASTFAAQVYAKLSSEKWFESRNIVLRTHSVTVTCVKVFTGHQPLVKIVPLLQIVRTSDVLDFIRLYFPQEVDHVPDVFITVENQFHRKNRRLDEIC